MRTPLSNQFGMTQAYCSKKPPTPKRRGIGVADGTRTRDVLDHNQVLYRLNYSHHYVAVEATDKA